MKKIFGVFLCSTLLLIPGVVSATEVCYNGNVYNIDTVNDNGKLYIPLDLCKDTIAEVKSINGNNYVSFRDAVELSGKKIQWNSETKGVEIIDTAVNDFVTDNESVISDSFAYKLNSFMPLDENYNFSPISIKIALAMLANGAEGETRNEIMNVLGIEDLRQYNNYVKKIIDEYSKDEAAQINITNSMWFNSDKLASADINNEFVNLISNNYNGQAEGVSVSEAQNKVDLWIKEATKGEIDTVPVSDDFFVQLINATYFKGEWENKFSKYSNVKDIFTDINGKEKTVEYMHGSFYDNEYYSDNNITIISLPYKSSGSDIRMYIAVTDDVDLDLEKYIDKMSDTNVDLYLPKFESDYKTDLIDILESMGVKKVFTEDADLSAMIKKTADITSIGHRSKVRADEDGTVAAAYTSTICGSLSVESNDKIEFKVNKPFTFFIRDNINNEVLFMGRCNYINN